MYQQQNAEVAAGVLAIHADVAPGGGYVSARLAGAAGRAFAPGPGETLRIEARIQLPRGDQQSSFRYILQALWQYHKPLFYMDAYGRFGRDIKHSFPVTSLQM